MYFEEHIVHITNTFIFNFTGATHKRIPKTLFFCSEMNILLRVCKSWKNKFLNNNLTFIFAILHNNAWTEQDASTTSKWNGYHICNHITILNEQYDFYYLNNRVFYFYFSLIPYKESNRMGQYFTYHFF